MNLLSSERFYRAKDARSKGAEQILGTKRKCLFSKLHYLISGCFWSCFLSALPYQSLCQDLEKSGSSLFNVFLVFVLFSVAIGGNTECFGKPLNLELRLERRKKTIFKYSALKYLLAAEPGPTLLYWLGSCIYFLLWKYLQLGYTLRVTQTNSKSTVCVYTRVYFLCARVQGFCKYMTARGRWNLPSLGQNLN